MFFICELRDDTAIAKKVSDQIHKGMLKSYSIAGSATKIQNMTKGLVPYLQVDDMELAEVTICEKGVNQGAGFELLKAEMPPIPKSPRILAPIRKINMQSNENGTINFNKSFAVWMQKEAKDPLTTKESFVTLHNEAGRKAEHEQLMREYGFPSEQSYETMRYVPVVETETDDDGIPIHNLPPWVVNEAGEALGDRLDEDAPDYDKSDKAKARQKAGSAQKMFYDFMGIEKAGEGKEAERDALRRVKASEEQRRRAAPGQPPTTNTEENAPRSPIPGRQTHKETPGKTAGGGFGLKGEEIAERARQRRAATIAIANRKGSAIGQDTPDPTPKDYSRGTPPGFTPGEGGRAERKASGNLRPQDFGGEAPKDFTPGKGGKKEALDKRPTGKLGAPKTTRPIPQAVLDRARQKGWKSRGENIKGTAAEERSTLMGQLRRTGQSITQGGREFVSGVRQTTPIEGRNVKPGAEPVGKRGGISHKLGRVLRSGAGGVRRGAGGVRRGAGATAGAAKRVAQAGEQQRQGWADRVESAVAPRSNWGPKEQAANQQMRIEQHHQNLGIGEGRIFSHPDFHGLDHAQQRAQVRESMMQRGGKTLEDHLKNYQHLVGNYPSTDENGTAGDKIGHVTVNSLPAGHHAGTPMDNNQFHQLIQDGHIGFEPTPKYANANWQEHKAHVDSHIRDASHIAPAIEGAAPQTQISSEGADAGQGVVPPIQPQPPTDKYGVPTGEAVTPGMPSKAKREEMGLPPVSGQQSLWQKPNPTPNVEEQKPITASIYKIAKAFGVPKRVTR